MNFPHPATNRIRDAAAEESRPDPPMKFMNHLVKFLAVLSVAAMALAVSKGALRPPSDRMSTIPGEIPN